MNSKTNNGFSDQVLAEYNHLKKNKIETIPATWKNMPLFWEGRDVFNMLSKSGYFDNTYRTDNQKFYEWYNNLDYNLKLAGEWIFFCKMLKYLKP